MATSLTKRGPHTMLGTQFTPHEAPVISQSQADKAMAESPKHPQVRLVGQLSQNSKKRRIFVNLDFTLEEAMVKPTVAVWKIDQDSWNILQTRPEGASASDPRTGNLAKSVILEMKVLQAKSDLPFATAVSISGIKGNAYSKKVRAPLFLGKRADSVYPEGKIIHKLAKTGISVEDIVYGNITEDSLNKLYTPFNDNPSMSIVVRNTILSQTIMDPQNLEEFKIKRDQKMPTLEYNGVSTYVVPTCMVEASKDALLEAAAGMSYPTTNLFQLEVALAHAEGVSWQNIAAAVPYIDDEDYAYQMKLPRSVAIELELDYVPELSAPK